MEYIPAASALRNQCAGGEKNVNFRMPIGSPVCEDDPSETNVNANSNNRGHPNLIYSSYGVQGCPAPMKPGPGDCAVLVGAQNLMANYIPVFNPKGAIVDMYGPPHGGLDKENYAKKIEGWKSSVEQRERVGGIGAGKSTSRAPEPVAIEAPMAPPQPNWNRNRNNRSRSYDETRKQKNRFKDRKIFRDLNKNQNHRNEFDDNFNQNIEPLGECLDYIDDEYKEAREYVRLYHQSLTKIHDTLKSTLKPGPPIGSRWEAFKNAFKAGNIARCPELQLSTDFDDYEKVMVAPGSPLDDAVTDMSQAYRYICSAKEALEHDIKTQFLEPLHVFIEKEWKNVVNHDKNVMHLASKIQKAKSEGRDQAAIADYMDIFNREREKTLYLFNFILNSDYNQINKFIDLVNCYIDYHKENLTLLEELLKTLRRRAKAAKPDHNTRASRPIDGTGGCMGTCYRPCALAPGLVTDVTGDSKAVEKEFERIFGAPMPPRDCGEHGFGMTCAKDKEQPETALPLEAKQSCEADGSAAFLEYMEKRIKTRPYGFVKEPYEAKMPGEMSLYSGEIVYLKGKPGFDLYCGEKEDGTKGKFPQKCLDIIVDIC